MNTKMILTSICIILSMTTVFAHGTSTFDSMMLSNGKLYTVVGVLIIIFLGIIVYLYNTDKKLKSLENQIKSE